MTINQNPYTSPEFLSASFAFDQTCRNVMPLHVIAARYQDDEAGFAAAMVRRADIRTAQADLRAAINLSTGLAVADLDSLGYQK